jgi:hypothetical protein
MIGKCTLDREALVPEGIRLHGQDKSVVKVSLQGVGDCPQAMLE